MSESSASVPPAYAGSAPATAKKGLSITSLVTGIAGIVLSFLLPYIAIFSSIAAIITGHLGKRREPAAKPFWLTGLITGYLGLLLNILLIVIVVAFAGAILEQAGTTAP